MKRLAIESLSLAYFKGHRSFRLKLDGENAAVFADNGVGKSSLFDAWSWLLFDVNSLGQNSFDIKTNDPLTEEPIPDIEHTVTAKIQTDDGPLTLRRTYKEVWETKRNAAVAEFSGHTNVYEVNGVPRGEAEFRGYIAKICPVKTFRLLTDPHFFVSSMKWEDRRAFLLKEFCNVTTEDILKSEERFKVLPEIWGQHTPEDFLAIVKRQLKETTDQLRQLPVRIDEAHNGMPEAPTGKPADVEALKAGLRTLQEQRAQLRSGGNAGEVQAQIQTLAAEMATIEARLRGETEGGRIKAQGLAREKDQEIQVAKQSLAMVKQFLPRYQEEKAQAEFTLQELRDRYDREDEKKPEAKDSCPSCGQALPPEKVAAAVAEFNEQQSILLEQIRAQGKAQAAQVKKIDESIAKTQAEIVDAETLIAKLESERGAIAIPEAIAANFSANAEWGAKSVERGELELKLQSIRETGAADTAAIDSQITETEKAIAAAESLKQILAQIEKDKARIKELGDEQKRLSAIHEELNGHLYLTEEFSRATVRMLTSEINSHFEVVSWKLFRDQVNGGYQDICEATIDGRCYHTALSNSERINAGLDVIRSLQKHFDFAPPIFIDNCESITRPLPMECQVIRLVVSEGEEKLRVKLASEPDTKHDVATETKAQEPLIA